MPALLAMLCVVLLSGCASTRGGNIPYEVAAFGAPDAPAAVFLEEDYRVAPGDTLSVTVYQVEDLSKDYRVDLAGNIAMPLIGSVNAVGSTTQQIRERIATRLGERYLRNPDVSVSVTESVSRNVTVDGSVRQPGAFPVVGAMTLIQAVAMARGTDEYANPRRVAIFRQIDGQRMAAAFDLTSIRRGEMTDPPVYAGDIVVVDGSRSRMAIREIFSALPVLSLFRPY